MILHIPAAALIADLGEKKLARTRNISSSAVQAIQFVYKTMTGANIVILKIFDVLELE